MKTICLLALFTTATPEVPSFEQELLDGIAARWEDIDGTSLGQWRWRDKNRFDTVYTELRDARPPTEEQLEAAAAALEEELQRHRRDEHFRWRAQEVLGLVAWDRGARDAAIAAFEAVLDAYPEERYAAPAKESSFHHLANCAAGLVWEHRGVVEAEAFVLERLRRDRRFVHFYGDWWRERYEAAEQGERLAPLLEQVTEICRAKAKKDKRNRAHYEACIAQLAALDLPPAWLVGEDPMQKYFLLLPDGLEPSDHRHLVLVLPGGNGQAGEFLPWLATLHGAVAEEYVFAAVSAPAWSSQQADQVVWVNDFWHERFPEARFSTEELIDAVAADVAASGLFRIDKTLVFGWSSSGPAIYATSTRADATYDGYYVLSSVFKPDQLDLAHVAGRRYYLQQGNDDRITAVHWARDAKKHLSREGAKVRLETFNGGHGFAMPDPARSVAEALDWLVSGLR